MDAKVGGRLIGAGSCPPGRRLKGLAGVPYRIVPIDGETWEAAAQARPSWTAQPHNVGAPR